MSKRLLNYRQLIKTGKGFRLIVLFISFFLLFGMLTITIANTYDQTEQKNKQLALLENDLKKEEEKNKELQAQKDYYKSDSFIEKEARDSLGLSFPNEEIYIIKRNQTQNNKENSASNLQQNNVNASIKTIFDKWLDLIFG